jgi:hypothetical protein
MLQQSASGVQLDITQRRVLPAVLPARLERLTWIRILPHPVKLAWWDGMLQLHLENVLSALQVKLIKIQILQRHALAVQLDRTLLGEPLNVKCAKLALLTLTPTLLQLAPRARLVRTLQLAVQAAQHVLGAQPIWTPALPHRATSARLARTPLKAP